MAAPEQLRITVPRRGDRQTARRGKWSKERSRSRSGRERTAAADRSPTETYYLTQVVDSRDDDVRSVQSFGGAGDEGRDRLPSSSNKKRSRSPEKGNHEHGMAKVRRKLTDLELQDAERQAERQANRDLRAEVVAAASSETTDSAPVADNRQDPSPDLSGVEVAGLAADLWTRISTDLQKVHETVKKSQNIKGTCKKAYMIPSLSLGQRRKNWRGEPPMRRFVDWRQPTTGLRRR